MHFKEYLANLPAYKPAKLIAQPTQSITKFSSNENALGPSPKALAAIQAALPNIYRYPDSAVLNLRQKLADHADLPLEAVICSNGSDEMILLLCYAFLREGDEAVMVEGTFISYFLRTLATGGKAIRLPLHDFTHNLAAMVAAITPRTRLLFICNPNNPTGTMNTAAEMQEVLAKVPSDVLIVVDEAYKEFVSHPAYPDLLPEVRKGRQNLVLMRTFAKIHGLAGLRLGYTYGHPTVIDYLNRARPVFNVNSLAQVAGIAALEDEEHIARSRAHTEASRTFFMRELANLGLQPIPSQTNFLAFEVGDDAAVTDGLFAKGFTITPLSGWGLPGYIRISFGTMAQNEQFMLALESVLATVGQK